MPSELEKIGGHPPVPPTPELLTAHDRIDSWLLRASQEIEITEAMDLQFLGSAALGDIRASLPERAPRSVTAEPSRLAKSMFAAPLPPFKRAS
jgi:hypothetical protein